MSYKGRKFSTIKKRLSFTKDKDEDEMDSQRERRKTLKAKLTRNRRTTRVSKATTETTNHSDDEDSLNSTEDNISIPRSKRVSNITSKSKSLVPVFEEMPSPEQVEILLEKTMEELAMPEATKEKFKAYPIDEKWKIVQMHANYHPKKLEDGHDIKSAPYWIRKLSEKNSKGRPRMSPEESLKMQSVFRTAHKDFITDFLEKMGVSVLNSVTNAISGRLRRDRKEAKVLMNIIECYRLLMNTELGMRGVILIPGSVKAIAMAMDLAGSNTDITEKVMLLLSVMCWWDEDGRVKVMGAMRHIKKRHSEISSFQTIVYLLEHTDKISFKASVATFVTTVCNTPPEIEQRVGVRNYFFRLDIISVFQKVLNKAPEGAFEEEGPWQAINTQYQVFVAMMKQDQEEIVDKLIASTEFDDSHFDLSNLKDSWKILQRTAFKADCQLELLNLIQALFLIPTVHELAQPIFESIVKFIYEASSMDNLQLQNTEKIDFEAQPIMNFEELGIIFKKKLEYNARMEMFSEKEAIVKRLRKLVGVMQKRLIDVASGEIPPEEAMDLQEDLIKNHLLNPNKRKQQEERKKKLKKAPTTFALATSPTLGAGAFGNGDINISFLAGLGLMDTAGEVEILKQREAKMKTEIDKLQKKVQQLERGVKAMSMNRSAADPAKPKVKLDSTGLEPSGPVPGIRPMPVPPVPKEGMPGSLENAPLEYNPNASPPKPAAAAPGGGAKAAALAAITARAGGGGPKSIKPTKQEGGLADLFAARAKNAQRPKNNKNEKYKAALQKLGLPDKKPMKPTIKMTQVFWKVIAPDALEGTIWPELSDQGVKFDVLALEEMFGKKEVIKKMRTMSSKPVSEVVKLIDGKRRQNLAIALRRLKADFGFIKQAITEINLKFITKENVLLLLKTIPSNDERTLLEKYVKDNGDVSKLPPEEKYLSEVVSIPNLHNRLKCIQTFYRFAPDARRVHTTIVKMKAALKEVNNSADLREVLQVVLAIGNYMNGGSARGAAWGFKLDILTNLINVKSAANNGTLIHFIFALFEQQYPRLCEFSLPASAHVVDVNFKEVAKDMNVLSKSIAALKIEVKKKPFSKADKLRKTFSSFEVKATRDCEKLQQLLEATRTDFYNLALKFAEKGNDVEPNTFFPKLVSFEQDLKRAAAQVYRMREQEAKAKLQQEKKQERLAYKQLKMLVEKTKDENGEINLGLVEAYRRSQKGQANEVVDRFLEKYNRDKSRQSIRMRRSVRIRKKRDNG